MELPVSVIMPAYNCEKYIDFAIDSVVRQSFSAWELIVVDDGSSDGTVDIVKKWAEKDSRIRLVSNPQNMGSAETRNAGARAASGSWIALLDSDDAWREDKLSAQVDKISECGGDIIFTGSAFMDENNESYGWNLEVPEEISYKKLLKQNLISNSSVLVKKDLFLKYNTSGGKDITEDFACWLQILRDGGRAVGINEPMLIYRISREGRSNNKLKSARMTWGAYRHTGLNLFQSLYYMCFYMVNGVKKYGNIKK